MKKTFMTLAMMLTTIGAIAQKNVEKVMNEFINDQSLVRWAIDNYDYPTDDGNATTFCHYTALQMNNAKPNQLNKLIEAFERDQVSGYKYIYMNKATPANPIDVVYGPNLEYKIQFCRHKDHNYKILFVNDKKNPDKRYVYAMVWYKENFGTRCLLYTIYGDKPAKREKATTNKLQKIPDSFMGQSKGNNVTTTTVIDGNDVVTITTVDGGKVKRTVQKAPTNSIEFISQFGNLRTAFLDAIKDSEQKNLQTGIAIKILDLCKNHSKLLSKEEKTTCSIGINDMLTAAKITSRDKFISRILENAELYLQ